MSRNLLLPLVGILSLLLGFPQEGNAQGTAWVEDASLLTAPKIAYAGPGTYYTEDLAIRSNQEPLRFTMGSNCFFQVQVRVIAPYTGSWQTIYDGSCGFGSVGWPGVPTATGTYRIEMKYLGIALSWHSFTYDLFVVPAAQRAFRDGQGNSMILWTGTTSALDSPFLVVEGIDAENMNSPSLYYQLGLPLFKTGRERGADVLILNFKEGGADLRTNAGVVERAVLYLNQIKTGTRRIDVAGLSMGGVVTRFALARMEDQGTPHNVQRFVSVDAPQQGAWVDASLQNYIRDEAPSDSWPKNLTSTAGKQLLTYNAFDPSGGLRSQFLADLNALNGGGYPHQTTENIGVSFGTASQNPNTGVEWLYVHDNIYFPWTLPPGHFYIEQGTTEAVGGSWLPRTVTDIWVKKFGYIEVEFERYSHPTFIPYTSALDIVSGVSRFAAPTIAPPTPRFHDEVPPETVEPLLVRLGYPPPPLSVSFSGPSSIPAGQNGTWTSTTTGGQTPYASYLWEYLYVCSSGGGPTCPPGQICPLSMGPGCGQWDTGGTASTLTQSFAGGGTNQVHLRLTVTDGAGTTRSSTRLIIVTSGLREGDVADVDGVEAADGAEAALASSTGAAPVTFALEGARPNPFTSATVLRYALPEAAEVRLAVYDALGREVAVLADGSAEAGWHEVIFDASALPSGVYVVHLAAGSSSGAQVATARVTLMR